MAGAFGMVDAVDEPWDFEGLLQDEHGGRVAVLSFEERMPCVRRFLLATAPAKFESWVEIRGRSHAGPNAMVYIDEVANSCRTPADPPVLRCFTKRWRRGTNTGLGWCSSHRNRARWMS